MTQKTFHDRDGLCSQSVSSKLAIVLVSAVAAMALAGCGGGSSTAVSDDANADANATDSARSSIAGFGNRRTLPAAAPAPTATPVTPTPVTAVQSWYVDSIGGSDGNPGSQSLPWKTLARAAQQTLAAGDSVLLKCGAVWRESLTFSAANAPAGGATLGAWGSCTGTNRPIISGADLVAAAGWTIAAGFNGKPVYVAQWPAPVTALYWNGAPLVRARHPNYAGIGHEFSLLSAVRNATTLVRSAADQAALGSMDLSGARIVVRTNPWLVEALDVQSSGSDGSLILKTAGIYPAQVGQGYFIEGKLALLDTAGEWYYDSAAGRLYVWTPSGAAPGTGVLESVTRAVGVTVSRSSDMHIDQIAFARHGDQSLRVVDSPRTLVTDVSSQAAGSTGISIDASSTTTDSAGSVIRNALVQNAGVTGIYVKSPAVQVLGSQVDNTGVGTTGSGVSAGIYARSVAGSVQGNRVTNSGYAAIALSSATGMTVSGNTLVRACQRFTDCGAIYSGGAPTQALRSQIGSNAITDVTPNTEGAVGWATTLVAGIYLDEESSSHDVTNNMIARVGVGINLHNSSNNTIQLNHVWLTDRASVRLHNSSIGETVRGNVIQDNELYASNHFVASVPTTTAPTQFDTFAQEWVHSSDAALMFVGTNPNIVRRNVVGTLTAGAKARWSLIGGWQQRTLDLAQWNALASGDSLQSAYAARPVLVTAMGANLVQNGAMQTPGTGWQMWSPTPAAGGTLAFGTCTTGCADFGPGSTNDIVSSSVFQMSALPTSSLYYLRVRAQALGPATAVNMAVNRAMGDWQAIGAALMGVPVASGGETVIELMFNATSTDPARLNMTGQVRQPLRLRDVTVAPVGAYELFSPRLESTLLINETSAAKFVECPATTMRTCVMSDLKGAAISWPMQLPANSAKVVLSADAKWKPAP